MATSGLNQITSQTLLSELMTHTLMLDLETTRSGRIRHIGTAVLNGRVFERKERAVTSIPRISNTTGKPKLYQDSLAQVVKKYGGKPVSRSRRNQNWVGRGD